MSISHPGGYLKVWHPNGQVWVRYLILTESTGRPLPILAPSQMQKKAGSCARSRRGRSVTVVRPQQDNQSSLATQFPNQIWSLFLPVSATSDSCSDRISSVSRRSRLARCSAWRLLLSDFMLRRLRSRTGLGPGRIALGLAPLPRRKKESTWPARIAAAKTTLKIHYIQALSLHQILDMPEKQVGSHPAPEHAWLGRKPKSSSENQHQNTATCLSQCSRGEHDLGGM